MMSRTASSTAAGFSRSMAPISLLAKALDYETRTQHVVTIEAKDGYGGVIRQSFTLQVSDVAESPSVPTTPSTPTTPTDPTNPGNPTTPGFRSR